MPNKYNNIQQLIALWQRYEETAASPNLSDFGKWIASDKITEKYFDNDLDSQTKKSIKSSEEIENKQKFLLLIAKLSRIQEVYIKKFFSGLPINTLLEFSFLFTVNKNQACKKSEVINLLLVEYSTGIDILKRLIRLHLISESVDETDKRSKKLHITAEGKKVLIEALLRLNKIMDFYPCQEHFSEGDFIISILDAIDNSHKKIISQHTNKSYFELMQELEDYTNKG